MWALDVAQTSCVPIMPWGLHAINVLGFKWAALWYHFDLPFFQKKKEKNYNEPFIPHPYSPSWREAKWIVLLQLKGRMIFGYDGLPNDKTKVKEKGYGIQDIRWFNSK